MGAKPHAIYTTYKHFLPQSTRTSPYLRWAIYHTDRQNMVCLSQRIHKVILKHLFSVMNVVQDGQKNAVLNFKKNLSISIFKALKYMPKCFAKGSSSRWGFRWAFLALVFPWGFEQLFTPTECNKGKSKALTLKGKMSCSNTGLRTTGQEEALLKKTWGFWWTAS